MRSSSQKKCKINLNLYNWCSFKYSPDLKKVNFWRGFFEDFFTSFFEFEHQSYDSVLLLLRPLPFLGMAQSNFDEFLKSENSFGQKCHCESLFNCMCLFDLYSRKTNFTIHHGNYFSWNIGSCHLDDWECQQLQNFVQCVHCTRNNIL